MSDGQNPQQRRTVGILIFDEVEVLDFCGPFEVFSIARAPEGGAESPPLFQALTIAEEARTVTCRGGLLVQPHYDIHDHPPLDILLVPGGQGTRRERLNRRLLDWIAGQDRRSELTTSVCTGAFLLAEAGLLAGRRVTTHWAYCATLAARYPDVTVEPDPIFVRDGRLATSAGVTAGIDLALALVEDDLGREAALDIARHLVVFLRRPGNQAQFSAQLAGQLASREPLRDVQRWIAEHPAADLSVETLASQASLSPRQFARAFAAEVGMPPGRYVDQVRLEAARRRLEDTADGVEQTARSCGYGTPEAMRRAFVRALGVSPGEYRRRFRPAAIRN